VLTIITFFSIYKRLKTVVKPFARAQWMRFRNKLPIPAVANSNEDSEEVIKMQNMTDEM